MIKKLMGIVIVLLLVVSFSGVGYANPEYYIGFRYVQFRVLENKKDINILCVSLNHLEAPLPTNQIALVKLYDIDEGGAEVTLSDEVTIYDIKEKYPGFSTNSMNWVGYVGSWGKGSYYNVEILDDLIAGHTYQIVARDFEDDDHEILYPFRGKTVLPVVSSKSFKYKFDEDSNFYFHWKLPKDMFYLDPELFQDPQTTPHIRAMIHRYDNDGTRWYMWVRVPYLMSGVFVPIYSGIFDDPEDIIDYIEIGVQVRIQDNSSRSYSFFKTIKMR